MRWKTLKILEGPKEATLVVRDDDTLALQQHLKEN